MTDSHYYDADGRRKRKPKASPEQRPLLDYAETPKEARAAALRSSKPMKAERCQQLLEWLVSRGDQGATAYEASSALEWPYTSMQSLFGQLRRDGLIRCNGVKRPTNTGSLAAVFTAVAETVAS